MFSNFWRCAALSACTLPVLATAIPTIYTKGSKFFTGDGQQFFLKGIAYQLTPDDPLVDTAQCQLDIALMKQIGTNSIRVYHVDPTADHSGCMNAFADAGIYLFVDLDTFSTQINQTAPEWTASQLSAFEAVMDEFQQYDNTAGFFVGNEVLTYSSESNAAPFVKAAAADVKKYRDSKGYRNIPVGYSAADIPSLRPYLQNYLACGDPSQAVDFYSLNAYEWCGTSSTFDSSGYVNLYEMAQGYPVPIFLSETGCIVPPGRTFDDQTALLGPDMDNLFSGSIVYEWVWENNWYGLVAYSSSIDAITNPHTATSFNYGGTPTPVQPDFSNLSQQWASLTATGVSADAYQPKLTPPPCPSYQSPEWLVSGNVPLPTLGAKAVSDSSGGATVATSRTAAAATTSSTTGAASGGKEVAGMTFGLTGVLLGFAWWL